MSWPDPGKYLMNKFNGRCARMCADGVEPPTFEEYVESHEDLYSKEEIEAARRIYEKGQPKKRKPKNVAPSKQ